MNVRQANLLVREMDNNTHTENGQPLANCGIEERTAVNEEYDEEEHDAEGHDGEEHDEEEYDEKQHGEDMDDEVLSEEQDSVGVPRAPIGQKATCPLCKQDFS